MERETAKTKLTAPEKAVADTLKCQKRLDREVTVVEIKRLLPGATDDQVIKIIDYLS